MKHVYLISNRSPAAAYGIGTYITQMIECLKGNNTFRVTLVELNSEENKSKADNELEKAIKMFVPNELKIDDELGDIRKISIPRVRNVVKNKHPQRYYRNIFYLLVPYVISSEENIFHFNYLQDFPLFAMFKARWPDSINILTIHYLNWGFSLKGNTTYFRNIIENKQRIDSEGNIYQTFQNDRQMFLDADRIICLSDYTKGLLISDYNIPSIKLNVVYNALKDEGMLLEDEERKCKKKYLLMDPDEKIVLFVGRCDEKKGLLHLIKAFRQVLIGVPNAHLFIAGSGNYDFFLKECIDIWSKITFTGKISKEKLYELYQIANIGVMPSFNEQCSYTIIEMMMHGIPIIGTDSTGLSEMIEEGINGYKVKLKFSEKKVDLSIAELSKTLLSLLNIDELLFQEMRKNSRLMFEKKYSISKMKYLMELCYQL
jgi:glycosyltransferase